jgi:hypothetical protein
MPEKQEPRDSREGATWLNEPPSATELAEWFNTNMQLDPALRHEDYVGGLVLIPTESEVKRVVGYREDNRNPIITKVPELRYTPFPRAATRVTYFWDLVAAHEEWVGVVQHIESPRLGVEEIVTKETTTTQGETTETIVDYARPGGLATMVHQLPPGFSVMSVPVAQGYSHFILCTIRVSIYVKEDLKLHPNSAVPVRTGRGTKQVPLTLGRDRPFANPNSIMNAETGAFGRALGAAGIFVLPGGAATAEDMMEALQQTTAPAQVDPQEAGNAGPAAPVEAPARTGAEQRADHEDVLRARGKQLYEGLSKSNPEAAQRFYEWAKKREFTTWKEVKGATLVAANKKLDQLCDEEKPNVPAEEAPAPTPASESGSEAS